MYLYVYTNSNVPRPDMIVIALSFLYIVHSSPPLNLLLLPKLYDIIYRARQNIACMYIYTSIATSRRSN